VIQYGRSNLSTAYDPNELKALALSDTGFVFDPRTGHSYSLNPTGLAVLSAMKEGLPVDALSERLRSAFECGVAVEDDVEAFVGMMQDYGLVGGGRP
jgi:hypothetical protein